MGQQFSRVEGFGNVIVRADLEADDPVRFFTEGGQQNNRDVGVSHADRSHYGKRGFHSMPMKLGFHDMRQHVFAMVDADGNQN